MPTAGSLWERVREDVRGLTERTRRGTRRAIEQGVLRVDLVSLRRARTRALADLGGRALAFWSGGRTAELELDAEAVRLRARIAELDSRVRDKEDTLARLRARSVPTGAESDGPASDRQVVNGTIAERPKAAETEETNGIS